MYNMLSFLYSINENVHHNDAKCKIPSKKNRQLRKEIPKKILLSLPFTKDFTKHLIN